MVISDDDDISGHQRWRRNPRSMVISAATKPLVVISVDNAISGNQRCNNAISGNQRCNDAIIGHQRWRRHHRSSALPTLSAVISGNQRCNGTISGNKRWLRHQRASLLIIADDNISDDQSWSAVISADRPLMSNHKFNDTGHWITLPLFQEEIRCCNLLFLFDNDSSPAWPQAQNEFWNNKAVNA